MQAMHQLLSFLLLPEKTGGKNVLEVLNFPNNLLHKKQNLHKQHFPKSLMSYDFLEGILPELQF